MKFLFMRLPPLSCYTVPLRPKHFPQDHILTLLQPLFFPQYDSPSFMPKQNNSQNYTGRFIMFFVITNIYNKKTKGPTLMEFFTATGKLKKFFF